MKSVLFIIVLVGIVSMGFFLKSSVASIEQPQPKQGAVSENQIAEISTWPYLLIGEWEYFDSEKNETWARILKGDIEFFKDGTFRLGYSHKKYDLIELTWDEKHKPSLIAGGRLKGNWQIIDNYILFSNIHDFSYKMSYPKDAKLDTLDFNPASYFEGKKYGTLKEQEHTDIINFDLNKIEIKGKRYNTGADILYKFTNSHIDPLDTIYLTKHQ